MRNTGPFRLLFRGILFLPLMFFPLLLEPLLELSGIQARHLAVYERFATQIRSGKVTRIGWDLRALKRLATPKAPSYQILVLGSSRSLPIRQDWFPGQSLWNASVDSGSLEDSAALLQIALEAGRIPHTVILEVPASLGRDVLPGTSRALDLARDRALSRYNLRHAPALSQLRDIGLWWNDAIRRSLSTWNDLDPDDLSSSIFLLSPDGARELSDLYPPPMPDHAVAGIVSHLAPEQLTARSRSVPTPRDAALFRRMLDDLAVRAIRVIILTPPIHPVAWDFFRKRGGYDDTWLRAELLPRQIQIVGTFSPQASRATGADFLDAFHPRPALVRRLLTEAGVIPALPLTPTLP